jgi:dTDP-4-dehydrorhamnose reductase
MTDVDGCESDRDKAFLLNETGTRNVALACKLCSSRLVAISTDYVFSGEPPQEPWAWGEGDLPRPRTRRALLEHPRYYEYRNELLDFLKEYEHTPSAAA